MSRASAWQDVDLELLKPVLAVLTDIDDTLTLHGKLPAQAFEAIHNLRAAGVHVVPITGRPAGWCDHIARMWPVDGIVGENGAFYFRYDDDARRMIRVYAQSKEERLSSQARLWSISESVLKKYPGTAIASDQAYREIDVAIDFCEDVSPLPLSTAQAIADEFAAAGATAKVSSIHVNAWFGEHDKLSMSLRMIQDVFGINAKTAKTRIVYCGDSPNDSPMFGYFPLSVAVANAKPLLHMMTNKPTYITLNEGGEGFFEVADKIISVRK
jgi:HAD superfamily hydrolase (TIGR01484 family)